MRLHRSFATTTLLFRGDFLIGFALDWFYDFDTFCLDLCPAWRLVQALSRGAAKEGG